MIANVSVVIPCWRCKDTITRATDSVYNQTLLPKKVFLVDDASGDGTAEFLDVIASRYPRSWIEVIKLSENGGPGVARNAGWDIAKTEYVAFLDADDAWHPKKIELQFNWMKLHPTVVLSAHLTSIVQNLSDISNFNYKLDNFESKKINLLDMLFKNYIPTRSVMVTTNARYRFHESKRLSEDYLLWLDMLSQGEDIYLLLHQLAFSFKPDFGHSGLTKNLLKMELAELENLIFLLKKNRINIMLFFFASLFSIIKFIKRLISALTLKNK